MDTQPPSAQNINKPSPSQENEISPERLHEQYLNLRLEVEQLYGKVDRLRGLLQTLVSGLIIATIIAIGISGWFAYRWLVQEQIAQRNAERAAETAVEIREQVEELRGQLQRQEEELQSFRQQIPDELTALTDRVQAYQRQLQLLRNRMTQLETPNDSSEKDPG